MDVNSWKWGVSRLSLTGVMKGGLKRKEETENKIKR